MTRARIVLVGLIVLAATSAWSFIRAAPRRSVRVSRAHRLERLATRAHVDKVRYRHGTYYRLAGDLRGATLLMDRSTYEVDGWALEGLGIEVIAEARRLQIPRRSAATLLEAATYRTRLQNRKLHVLIDRDAREYVLARTGEDRAQQLAIVPLGRFLEAGGKLP